MLKVLWLEGLDLNICGPVLQLVYTAGITFHGLRKYTK